MTLNRTAKATAAALLTLAAGMASAAGSQTLAVTATVDAICKFSAASTPLTFGVIDPSLSADKVVTANVLYKCSNGTASAGVTATGGLARTMTDTASNTLGYSLSFAGATQTGAGFGAGKDLTLVVTGTITAAQYQNAVASTSYAENVTLNITP